MKIVEGGCEWGGRGDLDSNPGAGSGDQVQNATLKGGHWRREEQAGGGGDHHLNACGVLMQRDVAVNTGIGKSACRWWLQA